MEAYNVSGDYNHGGEGTDTLPDTLNSTTSLSWTPGTEPVVMETVWGAREYIIILVTPIIVTVGTLGNILSVAVLLRPRFKAMSTTIYLLALAVADTVFLYANSMTKNFIKIVFSTNYSTIYSWACAAYVYVLLCSKCLSAWFIVAVTLERLLVIYVPIRAKIIATRRRAGIGVLALSLAILAIYGFVLVIYEVSVDETGKTGCDVKEYYVKRHTDVVLTVLDLCIYSLIPAVVLFASNAVLIFKVVKSRRFRLSARGATGRSISSDGEFQVARRLTVTLILISGVFLCLTCPLAVFLVHAAYSHVYNFEVVYRSLYNLELCNSGMNFFLYCLSGPAFRREVLVMFGCRKQHQTHYKMEETFTHTKLESSSAQPNDCA